MRFLKYCLVLFIFLGHTSPVLGENFVPGELLVRQKTDAKFRVGLSGLTLENFIREQKGVLKKLSLLTPPKARFKGTLSQTDVFRIQVSPTADLDVLIKEIKTLPDVDLVQKNYTFKLFYIPNDPKISNQWHVNVVHLPEAWEISQGSSDVVIAIIDSGVAYNHPDLANVMWRNPHIQNGIDSDGNDQDNDYQGWDFGSGANGGKGDNDPLDNAGHGTLVAGTAAAQTDNNLGGAGAAFHAKILPIKVTDSSGGIDTAALVQAVNYASYHGANVINLSLGGIETDTEKNTLLEDTINLAIDNGAVVVAAAGNISTVAFDIDEAHVVPATYPRVLTVGGANYDGDYDGSVSLYGDSVDVIAPDRDIYGPSYSLGTYSYRVGTGTSFAAPIVSGICALLKANNPSASPEDINHAIINSAEDRGTPGKDPYHGYGLVDAEAALFALKTGPQIQFSNGLSTYLSSPTTLNFTLTDGDGISENSIVVTLTNKEDTKTLHSGDDELLYVPPTLSILPEAFDNFPLTNLTTVQISVADLEGLMNTKTFTFYQSETLSLITLLNSPNPFDPSRESTTFHIELSQDADITMAIYSLGLRRIKTYPEQHFMVGYHTDLTWDGRDEDGHLVPNGVYVLLVKAKNSTSRTVVKRYKIAVLRR